MKDCTFHPNISEVRKHRSNEEFYNSQKKWYDKVNKRIEEKQIQKKGDESKKKLPDGCTFHPDLQSSFDSLNLVYDPPPQLIEGEKQAYINFYKRLEKSREIHINNPHMWLDGSNWKNEIPKQIPFQLRTEKRGKVKPSPIKTHNKSKQKPFK